MAAGDQSVPEKPLNEVVSDLADYPLEAFRFVEEGLAFSVENFHGPEQKAAEKKIALDTPRHLSGQQLCEGLRQFSLDRWGMMAGTVLRRWNITRTFDFGRIVFALIEAGRMQKNDDDSIDDFRDVYDFKTAFAGDYRIEHRR